MITDLHAKSITSSEKIQMLYDSENLYLMVTPKGKKYWIYRFWENKREHRRSLGSYPRTSVKEARIRRDELQAARRRGEDITRQQASAVMTFGEVSGEWERVRHSQRAQSTRNATHGYLERYILPVIGSRDITSITSADVLKLCRRVESKGHLAAANLVRGIIGQVFRYAIVIGAADNDPTTALAGALQTRTVQHYRTLTDAAAIHELVRAMQAYPYPIHRSAMLFSIHTFVRPGEAIEATWDEIDVKEALWRIKAHRTKRRRPHLVPLSRQVLELLDNLRGISIEIQEQTGTNWLFPSTHMSGHNIRSIRYSLSRIGYGADIIVPHGFRAMASTVLNESELFRPDVIERQLAHVDSNQTRASYNRAEYMKERRVMMQWWSDFLCSDTM